MPLSLTDPHGSQISSVLGSPEQSRLYFHSFMQWLLSASMKDACATDPTSVSFFSHGGRFHSLFTHVSFLPLNSGLCRQHFQVQLPTWLEPDPLESHLQKRFPLLLLFSSRKFLRPFLFMSWKLSSVGSCWTASSLYSISCQASPYLFQY